jgi:hypothetical protein
MKIISRFVIAIFYVLPCQYVFSQGNPPWQNALILSKSDDGIQFNTPVVFQDSSGVPSVIQWKPDTLVAVFQWFRQPNPSPTWDRVAVKFSYDNGNNWTQPVPIVVNGLPVGYQRPFDPTLVLTADQKLRIYFSSSNGVPAGGLDSTVNTYSAISTDGINYIFEPGPRFDQATIRVIDPAVSFFNGNWHLTAPIGAPQDGAFHAVSTDGISFTSLPNIPSDNTHNWTGNLLVDNGQLRFYGSGARIWYNQSADGNIWSGYTSTNVIGGDPAVVKLSNGKYLMICVGPPNTVTAIGETATNFPVRVFPNPFDDIIYLQGKPGQTLPWALYAANGSLVQQGTINGNGFINSRAVAAGVYWLVVKEKKSYELKLIKK